MAEQNRIGERDLTAIETRRPDLSALCSKVRWARKPWTRRKYEQAILDALRATPTGAIRQGAGKAA